MFECFKLYRDLPYGAKDPTTQETIPPATRSHAKVAQRLGISTQYINRLSRQWNWVDRVTAWDRKIEEEEAIERQIVRREHVRKLEERAIQYRDDAAELYPEILRKIRAMLQFPLAEEEQSEAVNHLVNATGQDHTILKPVGWNLNTLARLISTLEDLARFASGADSQGVMDTLLERIDPAALTPEQRKRIISGEPILEVLITGHASSVQRTVTKPSLNGTPRPVKGQ